MRRTKWQDGSLKLRGKGRKVWFARYRVNVMQPDGTTARKQIGQVIGTLAELPTKRKAQDRLREMIREAEGAGPRMDATFGELINRWEDSELPHFSASTQKGYRSLLKLYIRPRLGNLVISEIGTYEVQAMVSVVAKDHSPQTTKRVWDLTSSLFRTAMDWKWVKENPCKGVKLPKRFRKPQPAVDVNTAARLIGLLEEPYSTLLTIFAVTGFRRSEVFALRWKCIDWDHGWIVSSEAVVDGQWGTPKGQDGVRLFPLPQWVLERLQALWEATGRPDPERPVFATRNGLPINPSNVLNRHLWPACDRLGVPRYSFHAFRRGVATDQVLSGVDPKTMQAWLGHKDVQTTLTHYAQADAGRLRGVVNAYSEKLRTSEYQFTEAATQASTSSTMKSTLYVCAPVAQKDRAAVS